MNLLDVYSWPAVNPYIGLVVILVGGLVIVVAQGLLDQQALRRAKGRPMPFRAFFTAAEARTAGRKAPRKQVRDTLGPFLGRVAVLVRGGIPLPQAMRRVAEGIPPNALTAAVIEALDAAATGANLMHELRQRAIPLKYPPLLDAIAVMESVVKYTGMASPQLAYSLRDAARSADAERMQELELAATRIPMKMSGLAVLCLLPALMIITVLPLAMQAINALTAAVK